MSNGLTYPLYLESDPAERAIIALALLAPSIIERVTLDHHLQPDEFQAEHHADAWRTILDLHTAGHAIDTVTVAKQMRTSDAQRTLTGCLTGDHQAAGIPQYVRIIRDTCRRRSWQHAGRCLAEATVTGDERLAARAEQHLQRPTEHASEDTATPEQVGHHVVDWLENHDAQRVAIPTGLPALDNRIGGGLRPGDTTAVGGWTSHGKSVLVDQILTEAHMLGYRCHAYVNEMSLVDRGLRMLARQTGVPHHRLAVRDLHPGEHERLLDAAANLPFGVTDCSQWQPETIARHIRANRWDLCVLDLLHNIPYERESELHRITAMLVAAARSSGSHLLLVCQLNEERAKSELLPPPVIRDIRGSGMVKNLCATVLLVYRVQTVDSGVVFTTSDATITAGKARHGQQGAAHVVFDAERMRFVASSPRRVTVAA